MTGKPHYKPEIYHSVTPYLIVEDAERLLRFMLEAFGAEQRDIMRTPDGRIMHAEVRIGDSVIMFSVSNDENPPTRSMLVLYVEDVDAVYRQALEAGGVSTRAPQDEFYGDRSGGVSDAFGNQWWLSTHVEDVSPEEMQRRAEALRQG